MAKINEDTEVSIPLKNLVGLIVGTVIAVTAYFGLTERIAFLEHNYTMMDMQVDKNNDWINSFKPPAEVQDTIKRVRQSELKIKELEILIEQFQKAQ
tara:strand:- start:620 stop:910 length:291 start_codon:yes stop_codon:yes gene_type:complete